MIRYRRCSSRRISAVAVLALGSFLAGCARLTPPALHDRDDPFDEVHVASYDSADPSTRRIDKLPHSAYKPRWFFDQHRGAARPVSPRDKIHPELRRLIGILPGNTPVTVMVTFTDTVRIPRFPRPDPARPRGDLGNQDSLQRAGVMIHDLQVRRSARYRADSLALTDTLGATILRTYWLLQASLVEIPLGQIGALSLRPGVVYVRPNIGQPAPSHDGVRANDVDAARYAIGSDHYFALRLVPGWMALLDTGVRTTHRLLCRPSSLCMVADCVSGRGTQLPTTSCSTFGTTHCETDGGGDTYQDGHGTSTAAILTGNDFNPATATNAGGWYRGVTRASLDCFQVYGGSDHKVRVDAVLEAFQLAVSRLDHVIVAEMQENTDPDIGDVVVAADHAWSTGAVVIAANGNSMGYGVGVPAVGRRVIGVGAYHLQFNQPISGLARGPTADGRIKPDLVAPSYTETAANGSDMGMQYFGGTSGATPYAAGAACLLRDWMGAGWSAPEPGQVYAHLILSGDQTGPFGANSIYGAGRLRLPRSGEGRYGKTWVSDATRYVEIPIDLPSDGVSRLEAAIWWPESSVIEEGVPVDTHNDVDLEIHAPGLGGMKASSSGANGVFERARVSGAPKLTGRWRLRIVPYTMRTGPQVVYWAASLLK